MKNEFRRAMQDSDHYVIEMDYVDSKGRRTHRTISPIRFVGRDRVLAMCLCREEPRQFYLDRCEDVRLAPAEQVLMPLPIAEYDPAPATYAPTPALTTCGAGLCLA
ncbi:WYL domain-containing protein [Crateriforma conspicua]|uniref:WYL domain-containing protein n=1 Tax=Crateriforma conspicua TaxID=2527996 RepID=A0A5C6FU26_9PLAN|nr:WYL domain-containing protein [Crateriforma conspicua]TWU66399.1 hypothetical protein V7x_19650 [Crateriforma conspicua]